jgi:TDG/mug DNA glycosylase family protein
VVALVGVTLYRAIRPLIETNEGSSTSKPLKNTRPIPLGLQRALIHGARVFVLPNPSGRNANFSYAEMLAAFKALRKLLDRPPTSA